MPRRIKTSVPHPFPDSAVRRVAGRLRLLAPALSAMALMVVAVPGDLPDDARVGYASVARAATPAPVAVPKADGPSAPAHESAPSGTPRKAPAKPSASGATHPESPYDLLDADLIRRTTNLLDARYLHPEDLDPATLFAAGLSGLARRAPDSLWIDPDGDTPGALMVGRRTLLLNPGSVATLKDLPRRFSDVFAFYLQAQEISLDDVEVEYAALEGMLGVLDRPTRLLVDRRLDAFNLRSRGTLSGIGCRIGRRQDEATVVEVLEDGPAAESGLREGDRIVRVDGESTVNMSIQDLVSRIRGPVGTQVTLDIRRGTNPPRLLSFTLTRRRILLENVEVLRLPNDVGYLRITNFNDHTVHNFRERLPRLGDIQTLKGLVIDLRGNGGGSLKQSAFMVDEFVKEGTMVRTEGRPDKKLRGLVRRIDATPETVLDGVPIAVLVDRRTASGAEILSGALKYMDRAVVIGRRTFGKGTVQKVFHLRPKASVKMTVARYVLPGDHFIQDIGIQPDILLVPLFADEDQIHFLEPAARKSPSGDKSGNGKSGRLEGAPGPSSQPADAWSAEAPRWTVPYLRVPTPETHRSKEEKRWLDFEIRFAAQLLADAGDSTRTATLAQALPVVERLAEREDDQIVAAFATRGIDWSVEAPSGGRTVPLETARQHVFQGNSPVRITLTAGSDRGPVAPGVDARLLVTVTNTGNTPLSRVRVLTDCPDDLFDNLEFIIGRLSPGETRKWSVTKAIPVGAAPGLRVVDLAFLSDKYDVLDAARGKIFVESLPGPRISVDVSYRVLGQSGASGNLDGAVAPGDRVALNVHVSNKGPGNSGQIQVSLKNPLRKGLELVDARAILDPIEPGGDAAATLTFDLSTDPGESNADLSVPLVVRDRAHHLRIERDLDFDQPWRGVLTLEEPVLQLDSEVPREPWRNPYLRITGQAATRDGIQVIVFYRGNQKVDRLLPHGAAGAPAETVQFKTRIPLEPGPNRLTVVCKSASGIASRRQIWVTTAESD